MKAWLIVAMVSSSVLGHAQQSYFNTPSSDQTKKGDFFVQEQLNLSKYSYVSNLTCVWGLPRDFEIGFNLFGITYDPTRKKFEQQHDPSLLSLIHI